MGLSVTKVLERLEALGNEKVRARNRDLGAGDAQYGVLLGQIRKLAKEIGSDHDLALALWETGNLEARLLAILTMKPERISGAELDGLVRSARFGQLADWLNAYVVKKHPERENLRRSWLTDEDPWAARAGWSLTAARVARDPDGLDLAGLLGRIEAELSVADPAAQWTMNNVLAGIGIHHAEHRDRAIAIGETLGVYRDYPVPKGCTSPFAPAWIGEMVRRQGRAGMST